MDRLRRLPVTLRHLLVILVWWLPLTTPLWRWTAVPCTHDGHLHYHRVAALRYAWEQGVFFSRWLPDLAFGYGYPFFIYREPIPLYAVLLGHLAGLPLSAAANLFYAVTILAAGCFMYLWARDLLGGRAALVSAVAYMAAPYVLIDALVRGNAPESMALPLLPLILWAGRRWLVTGRPRPFLVGALGLALLSLSHNISTLLFVPALLLYLAVLGHVHRLPWRPWLLRTGLLLGLGLGMTLLYTGGALLEIDQVTLQQSTTTRNNDFRFNFATPGEIWAPVTPADPQLINPPLPIRLGWVPSVLAGLGVLALWRRPAGRERRAHVWLMAIGAAGYLFLALAPSRPLWEALPLIDFVQFPWRLVGRAALPVAFLAGVPFAPGRPGTPAAGRRRVAAALAPALVAALLLLEAMPGLYPRYCQEQPFPTINDVHAYEHQTGLVGVDPEGSYFPRTVARRPTGSPLEADYLAGRAPQRFDLTGMPAGATAETLAAGPLSAALRLDSPTPFQARYLSFAFPGWTVTVDDRPAIITPEDPTGLITFPVPAGEHTITVAWRATPWRTALLAASLLALAGAVAVAATAQAGAAASRRPSPIAVMPAADPAAPWLPMLLATGLLLLAGKLLIVDRLQTPLRRAAPPPVTHAVTLQGDALRLAGFNLSQARVAAGSTFDIDLAWSAAAPPEVAYQSNVWLAGPEGLIWSDKGTERPRLYEEPPDTRLWASGVWGWDSREVQVHTGTPPGAYDIVLTLFRRDTLQPVTLQDAGGAVLGPTAVIGHIEVIMPPEPPTFTLIESRSAPLPALGVRLLGYHQDRDEAAPGDPVLVTLYWERTVVADLHPVELALLDAAGAEVRRWAVDPVRPDLPPAAWQPGQRLRGQALLRLPATLAGGRYRFTLADGVPLGALAVTAPDRLFAPPPVATTVGAPFRAAGRPLVILAGYEVDTDSASLAVTLVWQAHAEMATSYRVFVHLVDETGALLAQSDGEPAGWTRPTTGWAPGEFVVDEHSISLPAAVPAGPIQLRVGLYDPATGSRLLAETAAGPAEYVTLRLP